MGVNLEISEIETIVLAAMLRHKDSAEIVLSCGIEEKHFSSSFDKEIFSALKDLFLTSKDSKYNIFDLKSKFINANIQGRCDAIRSYTREGTFNTKIFADALIDRSWVKEVSKESATFHLLVKSQENNPNRKMICEMSYKLSESIINNNESKKFGYSLRESCDSAMAVLEERILASEDSYAIKTPYSKLNSLITGFSSGKLYIVAGRPGMGKTTLALNLATEALSKNKNVVLFSMEMGKEEIATKIMVEVGEININLLSEKIPPDFILDKISKANAKIVNWPLKIYDDELITIESIKIRSKLDKMKNKIDLLIIDYLSLLGSEHKHESLRIKINYITRVLKMLAKELQIPILLLCQLNRNIEKNEKPREPLLSDLKESGSIEQDADVVIFINRDSENKNMSTISIAKNRSGALGKFSVIADMRISKFVELQNEK